MQTFLINSRWTALIYALVLIFLIVTACQSTNRSPAAAADRTAGDPTQPAPRALNLTAGLSGLDSYQIRYKKSVLGMLDGAPYESSTTVTRSLVAAQAGEEATVDSLGPDGTRVYLHYIRLGDERYYQSAPDQPCTGSLHSVSVGLIGDPAALLPAVTDPQPAGSEVINGIEATRYPLDAASLVLTPEAGTVTGSLWIAEPGGYLVKYSLDYQPPAATTGTGLEAVQTIEYELSRVNEIAQIELPPVCIPILTDIPALPDATRVERRSGLMSYYSASGKPEVAAFYAETLPALGWQTGPVEEGDPDAGLSYSKDGSLLNILLESTEEGLLVSVLLSDPAHLTLLPPADIADFEFPEGDASLAGEAPPEPIIDPLLLGLPPDIPLYPGATQVQSMSGMGVSFSAPDAAEQVVQFYTDVLTRAGWQSSPMPAQAGGMMIWMKGNELLNLSVQVIDDGTTRVSIMVVGG